jgi:hypothetical protein
MPNWADVVNDGLEHAPPPAEVGVGDGLADVGVGDGDVEGVGGPAVGEDVTDECDGDGDGDGDAERLAADLACLPAAAEVLPPVTYAGTKACVGCPASNGMAVASPSGAASSRATEVTAPAFSATAAAGAACQPLEPR